MKRRQLLHAIAAVSPTFALSPVQAQRVMRLGVIHNWPPTDALPAAFLNELGNQLKKAGWEQGRNLIIERRFALGDARMNGEHALELVAARVDTIYAIDDTAVAAAWRATKTIPIVMIGAAAVELGYARSLAQPGGNITGVGYQALDIIGKKVSLLEATRPEHRRVGIEESAGVNPMWDLYFQTWQTVASAQGAAAVVLPRLSRPADIDATLAAAKHEDVQALVLSGVRPFLLGAGLQRITTWAADNKVLTFAGSWAGGQVLLCHGPYVRDLIQVTVRQIDHILRGAKPAEVPIEQPTRFELIVNQKIARATGLTIPPAMLLQATQVIE